MKFCHKYLVAKQLAPADDAEFKKLLHDIWFKLYNRTGRVRFFSINGSGLENASSCCLFATPLLLTLPYLPGLPKTQHEHIQNSSCGFEHVFVGEISGEPPKVVGFHNWMRLYVEERLRCVRRPFIQNSTPCPASS